MTTQAMSTPAPETALDRRLPPLESGDRLTRVEFERRYAAMPGLKKAELIEGVVYVPSPVSNDFHASPHARLMTWLGYYLAYTPGVDVGDNSTVRLDLDNEPQPDALMRILPERGGQSRSEEGGYIGGPPELIAEVAASSASYDLHVKKTVYRRNGVREYIVWRVYDRELDWFVLREGRYEALAADAGGVLKSEAFPGLWLDAAALLNGDLAGVLAVLQNGIDSTGHRAFVASLPESGQED